MKRRILSIITALALCLSLCPTWALAAEADPSLCKHHPEHTEDCGYTAPTEGHDCGHEHTAECYTLGVLPDADSGNPYEIGADTENRLDCHHSHNSECGYVQADPGTPCGYECRICPIEDLIAALPEEVTADNAAIVRGQLDEILDLYRKLTEDEQEQIDISRCLELREALDAENASMRVASTPQKAANSEGAWLEVGTDYTYNAGDRTYDCIVVSSAANEASVVWKEVQNPYNDTLENKQEMISLCEAKGGRLIKFAEYQVLSDHQIVDANSQFVNYGCQEYAVCFYYGGTLEWQNNYSWNDWCYFIAFDLHRNPIEASESFQSEKYYDGAPFAVDTSGFTWKGEATPDIKYYSDTNGAEIPAPSAVGTYYIKLFIADQVVEGGIRYEASESEYIEIAILPIITGQPEDAELYYGYTSGSVLSVTAAAEGVTYQWYENGSAIDGATQAAYTVPTGKTVGTYRYDCEVTLGGYTEKSQTASVTVIQSGTGFPGEVKTYKGETETTSFTAGDTITVKATPTPTGAAPDNSAMFAASFTPPGAGQMAVFVGDTQVSAPVDAVDGSYTMTVSAADVLLAANGPGTGITLTAKFVENDNMADGTGTATVNITAVAVAEKDGKVIGYYGESNLDDAFTNDSATVTLLDNITTSMHIGVDTGNLTLDLNGKTITKPASYGLYVSGSGHLTIRGNGKVICTGTSGFYPEAITSVGGTLTLEGGTFIGLMYGVRVDWETSVLSVTGESVSIQAERYGLRVAPAQSVQLSAGTYSSISVGSSNTLAGLLAENCAYYKGSTPILLSELEEQKELAGPVTVRECQHTGVEVKDLGDGKHGLTCPYCGYHSEHTTTPTATASGNTVTLNGGCNTEGCGYTHTLGSIKFTFPKVTYGQTEQTVTLTGIPADCFIVCQVEGGMECQNADGDTEMSITLAQLFGSAKVTAGEHKMKVSFVNAANMRSNACELNFTVDPAPLTADMVTLGQTDVTYNGTEQKPALSVKQGETPLTEGTDYEVSYTRDGVVTNDFTSAGTVNITVTVKGNYTGSVEKTYTIGKATPTIAWANNVVTLTYTGQPADIKPVVTLVNGETFSGTITYHHTNTDSSESGESKAGLPTNAGIYVVGARIPEQDNYTAAATAFLMLTINKADQTVPAAPTADEENIKDTSITLDTIENAEYKRDDGEWQDSPVFTDLSPNTPYTFYARLKEDANHNASPDSAAASITTKKTMLNPAVVTVSGTYTYTGAAIVPEAGNVTVELNGTTINSDQYTISATGNVNAGTAKLTVTATENGSYSGSASTTFTISPATPALAWSSTTQELAYTGSAATITAPTVTLVGSDTFSGTITYSHAAQGGTEFKDGLPTNAGTYTVKASIAAQGNYTAAESTNTLALTIKPSPVTLTFNNQTITYGGTPTGATASPASAEIKYSYTTEADGTPISGWPTNAGTYTVTAKVEATGNYGGASQTATLTINPKEVSNPTIELSPSSFDYDGTAKKPAVTVKDGTTVIPASEYTVAYSNNINAGDATVTITNVAGNYTVSGTTTFTITAKPLTGAKVEATGTFTYTGNAQEPAPTVTLGGQPLTANTDYTVTYDDNTNAGTAKITVTGTGNYSGTAQGTFTIGRADLTADGTGIASGTYGDKLSGLTVSGLTAKLGEATVTGTWKLTGDTVPNVGDSGQYTATFTPATGAGNYNALTAQVTLSIAKANYSGTKTASTSAKFGTTGTYDLSALLPDGATAGTAATDSDIFEGTPAVSGKTLTYTLKADAAVDSTGTITVPVTSANYIDFNLTITVKVTEKDVPTLTISPITVTYNGKAVPDSAIKGTAKVGSTTVPGTWAFASGEAVTNVADSGTKTVKFVPSDKDTYAEATGTVVVTIDKATPTGAPKYTAISANGKTLADAGLTAVGGTFNTEGTVAWALADTTEVTANTQYEWTFTPTDTANYNTLTGKITLWPYTTPVNPGGGGGYVPSDPGGSSLPVTTTGQGSSTVTTTTTAAPTASVGNGTATTTINTAMGNEIVKQAVANNSETVVIAPSVTGSVTKAEVSIPASTVGQIGSQTSASLTVSTPVADVTIPNGGLGSLSSAGGTVTVTAEQVGNSVELSVTAGGRTVQNVPGGVTLTVPAASTTPGTVAVLVHPDGTREVVRKSVADNGAVTIPLDGSAKLEIVDNSKYFADVPATSWATDAVAFASAHELFGGTGANQFSPDLPMSRGMLAVVLHNLESNPAQALTGAFADVDNSQWYAEGVAWAEAQGIIGGYGNGRFGPNDNITREQLAVMLWRYAGSPAATDRELHFADAHRASNWALEALRWATENGIINGKGGGILDPTGQATRAETAQMLKNFMESK